MHVNPHIFRPDSAESSGSDLLTVCMEDMTFVSKSRIYQEVNNFFISTTFVEMSSYSLVDIKEHHPEEPDPEILV